MHARTHTHTHTLPLGPSFLLLTQDEVNALPLADAIETLTTAWTIAYRALGTSTRAMPAADLLSGAVSTFGAGLDQWRQEKLDAAAAKEAAANKKGVFGSSMSKAKGMLGFGRSFKQQAPAEPAGEGTDDGSVASGAEGLASPREEGSGGGAGEKKKSKFSLKKLLA